MEFQQRSTIIVKSLKLDFWNPHMCVDKSTTWIYAVIQFLHPDFSVSYTAKNIYYMFNEEKVFKLHISFTEA